MISKNPAFLRNSIVKGHETGKFRAVWTVLSENSEETVFPELIQRLDL